MKIRNGFITNSSSSSFIVAFPYAPKSVKDVQKLLFGDEDLITCYDETARTADVAKRVFSDLKNQRPNDMSSIVGNMDPDIDHSDFTSVDGSFAEKMYQLALKRIAQHDADTFISESAEILGVSKNDMAIYVFDYGDDSGDGLFEHGEIFGALPYKQISHH